MVIFFLLASRIVAGKETSPFGKNIIVKININPTKIGHKLGSTFCISELTTCSTARAINGPKRVQALGGAKNHCVVMPDADIDQAVAGLMGAAYGSAGERCMAQSVAVAVGNIADQLVNKLTKEVNNLKVGPGIDKGMDMGPLVTAQHLEKVTSYIDIGVKEGAKLIVDGRKINKPQGHEKGFNIIFAYLIKIQYCMI